MSLDVGFRYNLGGSLFLMILCCWEWSQSFKGQCGDSPLAALQQVLIANRGEIAVRVARAGALSAKPRVGDVHIGCCIAAADMPRLVMKRGLKTVKISVNFGNSFWIRFASRSDAVWIAGRDLRRGGQGQFARATCYRGVEGGWGWKIMGWVSTREIFVVKSIS